MFSKGSTIYAVNEIGGHFVFPIESDRDKFAANERAGGMTAIRFSITAPSDMDITEALDYVDSGDWFIDLF